MKKAWPTDKVMVQIYEQNLWGTNGSDFYSGEGSHNISISQPYIAAVKRFLHSFETPLIVCDLGCGDFNIGKNLVPFCWQYNAVDIVPELIKRNKLKFQFPNLYFHCLDIAKDNLPAGECVIIRQVFQHISNAEINAVLRKIKGFKYLILTEHIPTGRFEANKDKISSQGIRLKQNSGVDVLQPPFSLSIKSKKELQSCELGGRKGIIKTVLFEL